MIITVTQIVIAGDKRIEKTATAHVDRRRMSDQISDALGLPPHAAVITETARALFDSLDCSPPM
jgi:hypothetical protein